MKKVLFGFILFFGFLPFVTADCKDQFNKDINGVDISYNVIYEKDEDNYYFKVKFDNLTNNIKVYIDEVDKYVTDNKNSVLIADSETVFNLPYQIQGAKGECKGKVIKEANIKLPLYNKHYDKKVCRGLVNYKYCQKYIYEDIDLGDVSDRIKFFREKANNQGIELGDETHKGDYYDVLPILKIVTYSLGAVAIVLIAVLIFVRKSRMKK